MALEYIKRIRTHFHIGQSHGVSESDCFKIISWVEETLTKHPDFALPRKKEVLKDNIECEILVIDGTEALIERPKKAGILFRQEKETYNKDTSCYSTKGSGKIVCTSFANDEQRSFRIFKESKVRVLSTTKVLVDSGYSGIQKFHKNIQLPHKRSKKVSFTKRQKS